MTGARRAAPAGSGLIVGALLIAVLVLVLFYRPGSDDDAAAPPSTPSTPPSTEPSVPPTASEEAFCAEFRRLAGAQSGYAAAPDERAIELLREAADRMLAVGVPETMTLPARSGYFTLLDGVYQSIGLSLDPAAVGALDEPVDAADDAFSSYLAQFCPA